MMKVMSARNIGVLKASAVAVVALGCAATALADAAIVFDAKAPAFKDQRKSRTAPDLGYAGTISDLGEPYFTEFFVKHPDETWETFRKAGAYFVKEWGANWQWEANPEHQRIAFAWRKKHGVRVLLCLEHYHAIDPVTKAKTNDIEVVKKSILSYVKWIVDNGFRDQVAGFELGSEPYFGSDPENYAARWNAIVPGIKEIFPEVDIGFPVAEYRSGDPDIAAVRARLTRVDEWFKKGSGIKQVNQWSGRFVVALSNSLHLCSHIIYHFYGGDATYGVGPLGYLRIRGFAKVFPEVKDKKVWITEWRERSDEDNRCQQMHSSTIFKAHYMIGTICQPEIDGICLHSCHSLSGGFCIANGDGTWRVQFDPSMQPFPDPDFTGRPRLEVGPCGPLFKIFNEALRKHPLIMDHGTRNGGSITNSNWWSANTYYASHHEMVAWLSMGADPEKVPLIKGNGEWALLTNPERTSAALLVCNSRRFDWKPTFSAPGCRVGRPHYRTFRCKEEDIFLHQVPGEPRPTWEEEYDGDPNALLVPPLTIATITFPIEKEAK